MKFVSKCILACALLSGTSSFAQVVNGQPYPTGSLHCGGQLRVTGNASVGPIPTSQYSWIYYNCTGHTVRRKVDIAHQPDGACHSIGPKQAKVIMELWSTSMGSFVTYRGSKSC